MPELPEIETIKRVIEPQIRGLSIQRISVRKPEVIAHPVADEFDRQVIGQVFVGIDRKGKFLILCMESGDQLILHLRMTGCLLVTPANDPEEKHTILFFICPMAGSFGSRTLVVSDGSGYCGREKRIHTAESKNWEQILLNFDSPRNTYLHDWGNERKSSSSACWIKVL